MKVEFLCKSCKQYSEVKTKAISRFDLRDELGGLEPRVQCSECMSSQVIHVNRMIAVPNKKKTLALVGGIVLLALVMTIGLWDMGYVSTFTFVFPIVVYIILNNQEQQSINTFNKAYL